MKQRIFQLLYPKKVDDRREITAKMIDEIIKNSSEASRFPVAIGHINAMGFWEDDKPAAGQFGNLTKDEDGFLLGQIKLQPEVDEAYKAGKYPGWSVGIFKTEKDGWQMDHLALLGSVGAAFKDLQEVDSKAFSIVEHSGHGMTVECFSADNEKKTLWLVQSTPKPTTEVEQPAVNFKSEPQSNGGHEDMDPKELEAYKAETDRKMAELRADNEKLKADNEARLKAETARLTAEFKGVKDTLLKAAADKGVTETARGELSTALDAYNAHYESGIVSRELFDAMTKVISELKPKLQPGEITDTPDEDFELKSSWSGKEAVDALTESPAN
jgi:hypothetical protein